IQHYILKDSASKGLRILLSKHPHSLILPWDTVFPFSKSRFVIPPYHTFTVFSTNQKDPPGLFHEGVEGVNRSASMKEAMRPLRSRMPFIKTQPFFQIKKRKNPPGVLISVF
ncbi:MAG: hypothetical protein UHU21_09265, partial [Lachnospiraceae bacterium]|nr:hypothetical protein [Lachnospiraceae bacterium]